MIPFMRNKRNVVMINDLIEDLQCVWGSDS
jgi:hypothetical protein